MQELLPDRMWGDGTPETLDTVEGERVVPVERVLRIVHGASQAFPGWKVTMVDAYREEVMASRMHALGRYIDLISGNSGLPTVAHINDVPEADKRTYLDARSHIGSLPVPSPIYSPVPPDVDELRAQHAEGTKERDILELQLGVRTRVRGALDQIYKSAFGHKEYGEDLALLHKFREGFARTMKALDVEFEPIMVHGLQLVMPGTIDARAGGTSAAALPNTSPVDSPVVGTRGIW